MIKLMLDPEVVLREINTWRDASLMTRRRGTPHRESETRMLAVSMSGAAERVDGFLMLLQSCSAGDDDQREMAHLLGQLREFRDWVQQAQYAAQVVQTLSPAPTRKRAAAHTRR